MPSVTHKLNAHEVSHGVGHRVRNESSSSSSLEQELRETVLLGYPTISQMLAAIKHVADDNAPAQHVCNRDQLLQSKIVNCQFLLKVLIYVSQQSEAEPDDYKI